MGFFSFFSFDCTHGATSKYHGHDCSLPSVLSACFVESVFIQSDHCDTNRSVTAAQRFVQLTDLGKAKKDTTTTRIGGACECMSL